MTIKEFKEMSMDTKITVRSKKDGKFIKDPKVYNDLELCGVYAKAHRFGNPGIMRAEITVFAK